MARYTARVVGIGCIAKVHRIGTRQRQAGHGSLGLAVAVQIEQQHKGDLHVGRTAAAHDLGGQRRSRFAQVGTIDGDVLEMQVIPIKRIVVRRVAKQGW